MEEKILKLDPEYSDGGYYTWNQENTIIVLKLNEIIDAFNNRDVPFYLRKD